MELEVKDLTTDRQKYKTRVKSYQVELTKLETDVVCNSLFLKPAWGFGLLGLTPFSAIFQLYHGGQFR